MPVPITATVPPPGPPTEPAASAPRWAAASTPSASPLTIVRPASARLWAKAAALASPCAVAERAPTVRGDAGALAATQDERTSYNVAFDALKAGRYADATQYFLSFLELYPAGVYAPNALYWLGESYYVTQNYALAADQFRALLAQYPTHDKAAGALLKLGLCDYGLGKLPEAERTLAEVVAKYPGTDVARTADDRLRAIQLGRLR